MPRTCMLSSYQPFDLGVTGPLRDASRADAERGFARLLAARPARRRALAALWPGDLDAADAPARLGGWLLPVLAAAGPTAPWDSLCGDVALWLGDRVIAAAPQLRWELYTAHKKATGYQRGVLVGFTRVDDARYYVDIAHLVAAWGDLAVRGRQARAEFLQTIEATTLADA